MEQAIYLKRHISRTGNYFTSFLTNFFRQREARKKQAVRTDFLLKKIESQHSKNSELNESIIYAKRIQDGMMLKEKHLYRLFPESFLLFKPKDIVSGDFYWFTRLDKKIIVAVADCTGHGIPGAFMSVLGISLLNQIIIEEQQTNTSLILQRLNHKIKKAFDYSLDYQDEGKHYDGMDIGLCCIDTEKQTIQYSGAFRPLYVIQNQRLLEIKGSRYPIGGLHLESERQYTGSMLSYLPGDKLYLCSDGFADQFGGVSDKKFMTTKFRKSLLKTSRYSMQTQQRELERTLNEWKNNSEQTDDILIIGLQL